MFCEVVALCFLFFWNGFGQVTEIKGNVFFRIGVIDERKWERMGDGIGNKSTDFQMAMKVCVCRWSGDNYDQKTFLVKSAVLACNCFSDGR